MFSNMTTTHLCGSSAAVLCLLLSLYLGGQTYLINQTHDRFSESTILQGSALNTSATSRSLCPSNVYSATTSIQNSTMKIVGPMDCAIPFLPDPLAALTSNGQEDKWVISSGGSFHWGVSMNFLRLFLKTSDIPHPTPLDMYGAAFGNITTQQNEPPDIIELIITRDGTFEINAWSQFEWYNCGKGKDGHDQANVQTRVIVLHSRWMTESADRFESLVKDCGHHRPKPDLVVDVWGRWYTYCSYRFWEVCKTHSVEKSNWERQYRSDANILMHTTNALNASSLLYVDRPDHVQKTFLENRKVPFLSDGTGTHLTLHSERSIDYPYIVGHPTNAFAVGDAIVVLHTILGQAQHDSMDRSCYDISFMSEDCNPQHRHYSSWTEGYLQSCAPEVVPCIESSSHAD